MTFNDPSGNMLLLPRGSAMCYTPQPPPPAPPPQPQPSYEKATRNALVPGTSPNPAPPDQAVHSQALSIGNWFVQDFLADPTNLWSLVSMCVGSALLIIPDFETMSVKMNEAFYNFVSDAISGGFDFSGLLSDIVHKNVIGVSEGIISLGADALDYFWQSLSFFDKLEAIGLGAGQIVADGLSGGTVQEVADSIGAMALGIQIGYFVDDVAIGYSQYLAGYS
jgi:hypothetical protein